MIAEKNPVFAAFSGLLLMLGISLLGYFSTQSGVQIIYLGYGVAFLGYAGVLWRTKQAWPLSYWLALALILRLLLVFAFPTLSDDIYRFVWDGRLWLTGHNPFDHLPSWYADQGFPVPGLHAELYSQLNSPEYFTIYPPVAQAVFVLAVYLVPDSIAGAAIVMKLCLLAVELGSIWLLLQLLVQWKLPKERVLWYALNPLILIELTGNLHFEAFMVFFLLLGFWLLVRNQLNWAAVAFALSIASKLLPLMFMPFLIRRLGWRSIRFFIVLGVALLVLWLPLVNTTFFTNFGESLQLYFRRFEFNASVYYLLRELGYLWEGHNIIRWIGPRLAIVVLLLILGRVWWERKPNWQTLPAQCLFAIAVYLLLATTIHPWYTTLPLLLGVFTTWRWPILWTALIPLTYINYSYPSYHENLVVVFIEYSLVIGYALKEYFQTNEYKL